MKNDTAVDYQAALDQYRREEAIPESAIRGTGKPSKPPIKDGYVDYMKVSKDWEKEQAGKSVVRQD